MFLIYKYITLCVHHKGLILYLLFTLFHMVSRARLKSLTSWWTHCSTVISFMLLLPHVPLHVVSSPPLSTTFDGASTPYFCGGYQHWDHLVVLVLDMLFILIKKWTLSLTQPHKTGSWGEICTHLYTMKCPHLWSMWDLQHTPLMPRVTACAWDNILWVVR